MPSMTIAVHHVEARPGHWMWRGFVYEDEREVACVTRDTERDAYRAVSAMRDAEERGEGLRWAMLENARMTEREFGDKAYGRTVERNPDDTTRWNGEEEVLSWS